jgi:hypothetical protein
MTYADVDRDDEPNVELAQELLSKCRPLVEGSAQWRYLTETRGITPDAVRYCMADLRALEPQIKGFDRLARGVVSLLRDGTGEITGLAVEACGIAGERIRDANGQTMRRSYALKKRGQIDALFRVDPTGSNAMICYACEGRLAKPLAVAAVMGDPAIVGWGGLHGLGRCLPPEMTVVVVEDARPADDVKADLHDQAMARGSDRLIASGRIVLRAGGPRCACCKDLDEALGKHPVEELRAWLTSGKRAELSLDGEARRCAKIKDPIKRAEAVAGVIKDRALRKTPGMIPAFRKEVDRYAGGHADDDDEDGVELQGEAVTFEDILPWPEAVDGAQLVADIEAFIVARAIVPKHGPLTCALWVLHAHSYEAAYHSPRLTLRKPDQGVREVDAPARAQSPRAACVRGGRHHRPDVLPPDQPVAPHGVRGRGERDQLGGGTRSGQRGQQRPLPRRPRRAPVRRPRLRGAHVPGLGAAVPRAHRLPA